MITGVCYTAILNRREVPLQMLLRHRERKGLHLTALRVPLAISSSAVMVQMTILCMRVEDLSQN